MTITIIQAATPIELQAMIAREDVPKTSRPVEASAGVLDDKLSSGVDRVSGREVRAAGSEVVDISDRGRSASSSRSLGERLYAEEGGIDRGERRIIVLS